MSDLANNGVLQTILNATRANATESSGNITSGGTAQTLWVGTTVPKNGFYIGNPKVTGNLWISMRHTAAAANIRGAIIVPPNGGSFQTPNDMCPALNTTISIWGGTTGHQFTAFSW